MMLAGSGMRRLPAFTSRMRTRRRSLRTGCGAAHVKYGSRIEATRRTAFTSGVAVPVAGRHAVSRRAARPHPRPARPLHLRHHARRMVGARHPDLLIHRNPDPSAGGLPLSWAAMWPSLPLCGVAHRLFRVAMAPSPARSEMNTSNDLVGGGSLPFGNVAAAAVDGDGGVPQWSGGAAELPDRTAAEERGQPVVRPVQAKHRDCEVSGGARTPAAGWAVPRHRCGRTVEVACAALRCGWAPPMPCRSWPSSPCAGAAATAAAESPSGANGSSP